MIGFAGGKNRAIVDICKNLIIVSSTNTPKRKKTHILIGGILCKFVESELSCIE
jgi:hypothetical protein